eukprot:TRINITY_DN80768_c0_g1_i1.p1 TRINITY_DN80768_c0_g1~~TRINITY_DN80768_c0_g1_i1.p1  ORF type:complete len:288 (+),score=23.77 TRINITY_DN80768_c0_g1_i1:99-962(+)
MAAQLPAKARTARSAGPLAVCVGVVVGAGLASVPQISLPVVSVTAVAFFAGSNYVEDEVHDASVLCGCCGALGAFLGFGLTAGVYSLLEGALPRVPIFLAEVMLFHLAEFAFTAVCHPNKVEFRAFLLAPVPAGGYSIAMIAALIEYWLRQLLMPSLLPAWFETLLFWSGAIVAFLGWAMRTTALFTAGSNFTHLVSHHKHREHELVTNGVYSLCRHPGYVGWFAWSVATQLVLGNTLCFFAYVAVSFKFFAGRIPGEEAALVNFFGQEYMEYARNVPCGIPGTSRL